MGKAGWVTDHDASWMHCMTTLLAQENVLAGPASPNDCRTHANSRQKCGVRTLQKYVNVTYNTDGLHRPIEQ